MNTSDEKTVKEIVKESYTKAVTTGGGCCSTVAGPVQIEDMKGVLVKSAGYTPEELAALPAEAVENAFGCGNPLAFAGVRPGQVVLDIGSGAGIDCLLAAQSVEPDGKVIGLDMTPAMLEKARANAKEAGVTNVEFRMGEAEKMPVESETVDWVISNCVINLSPKKRAVFAEVFRVLKSGGQVSISDIVAEDLPEEIKQHARLYTSCVAGAVSEKDYVREMQAAGLADVQVRNRMIYNADQLKGFLESEMSERLYSEEERQWALDWTKRLAGKIASIKIYARKP